MRFRKHGNGLTLMEIVVTMGLVLFVAYLALTALKPGKEKGTILGLATAVKEEFEATRQLAIRSGQPVALGIPTNEGGTLGACSLYRLQGWNTPYVKWSGGYAGDYPGTAFAAATWTGAPAVGGPLALPPSAKYFNFGDDQLFAWLPDDKEQDYIFCYLPDGSLITNGLPTSDGRYPVVLAGLPSFGGAAPGDVTIDSGNEAWTLFVSPGGGVELKKGPTEAELPSGTGDGVVAPPNPREIFTGTSHIYLSEMKVRPNPSGVPGEGICVPGQVVTLEIYAHCPEGDELFANWTQTEGSITPLEGTFTYPNQVGSSLPNEADRMEFIPPNRIPTDPEFAPIWKTGEEPAANTGVWRAKWTWTVPTISQEGDLYLVTANVQNEAADAQIVTSPLPQITMNPAPQGRMIVERRVNGLWQLWRMNPDGSGEKLISPEGVQEMMPTLDKNGTQMALIRQGPGGIGDRYIVVRSIDGGLELVLDGPSEFSSVSISPTGEWVGYRDNGANRLIAIRANGSGRFEKYQYWAGTGTTIKKGRAGWSQDGRYLLYGNEDLNEADNPTSDVNPCIYSVELPGPSDPSPAPPGDPGYDPGVVLWGPYDWSAGNLARIYCPTSYTHGGNEYVAVSCSGEDSFILSFLVSSYTSNQNLPSMDLGGPGLQARRIQENPPSTGSPGMDQDYPGISHDGKLVYTSSPANFGIVPGEDDNDQQVFMLPNISAAGVFSGPPVVLNLPDTRRAIFIPPGD